MGVYCEQFDEYIKEIKIYTYKYINHIIIIHIKTWTKKVDCNTVLVKRYTILKKSLEILPIKLVLYVLRKKGYFSIK